MADMALGKTASRTPVTGCMVWVLTALLFALGSWLIGQGAWIHAKAVIAQWLLQKAWHETLITQRPVKPWAWADTWPVGRLIVPRLKINQLILADASGQSLAFGPGKVGNRNFSNDDLEGLILSGHRDTHFSFIRDIRLGEKMNLQTVQGEWRHFVVNNTEVLDSRIDALPTNPDGTTLQLITCYPFDAVLPGGPLRYVVTARPKALKKAAYSVVAANTSRRLRK